MPNVNVSDEIYQRLKERAKKTGQNIDNVADDLIETGFDETDWYYE